MIPDTQAYLKRAAPMDHRPSWNDLCDLFGGLHGASPHGWLLGRTLWVSVEWRGEGIGVCSADQRG
ncbi:MAG: hypothetical protein ACI8TF_001484 [Paracoccaceae bacterium]|jgi:hypothetical protein